ACITGTISKAPNNALSKARAVAVIKASKSNILDSYNVNSIVFCLINISEAATKAVKPNSKHSRNKKCNNWYTGIEY
ncbi:39424_t:CDS:1, partial [Gigaspora margarita]